MSRDPGFSIRINCVSRTRVNGMIQYVGFLNPAHIEQLLTVKPFDEEDGLGYQRPVSRARTKSLAKYLSRQQAIILPPILLNAAGNWEYVPDSPGSDMGALICTGPASIIDGQHRIEGIKRYLDEFSTEVRIPFCAIHNLDDSEEIDTFLVVNTSARPIKSSHVHYLQRDQDPIAWVATQLATLERSPFYGITTLTGSRQWNRGIRVTLQNLVRVIQTLSKKVDPQEVKREDLIEIAIAFYSEVKRVFPAEWADGKHYVLTQVVALNALANVAAQLLGTNQEEGIVDLLAIEQSIASMKGFDWSREKWKGISGREGTERITMELYAHMVRNQARRT